MKNLLRKSRQANTIKLLLNASLISAVSAVSMNVNASDAIGPGDSSSKWVLGLGAGVFNNPYSGEGTESVFGPNIRYNGERFFVKDGTVNLHLAKSNGFSGGLSVALNDSFLSDKDEFKGNEKLRGLSERDATALAGVYLNHDTDLGRLSFSALTDIGDKHDGHSLELNYTFDLKAGNWNINPELGAQWVSADYVDNFVGVSASEATSSRLEFRGASTVNTFAGIRARYEFTENLDIDLRTGVSKLGAGFKDSPIIDDDIVYHAAIGINYNY